MEVEGKRWVSFARVSTSDQFDNTSTSTQISDIRDEIDRTDGTLVKEFEVAESAAEMDRESLQTILEMARNDEFDILGVWKLDRLTRSDHWSSFKFLHELRNEGVTLYSDNHGYFEWNEQQDFRILIREVLFARQWYTRLQENSQEGQVQKLNEGKYPFGQPPWGYYKDEDDVLHLSELGAHIIPDIFETYLDEGTFAGTRRQINKAHELDDEAELTSSQVRTVLENSLCLGQLTLKGEIIEVKESLQAVTADVFNKVQDRIAAERESDETSSSEANAVPGPVENATQRFGPEFIGSLFETFQTKCPTCGSDLERVDDTVTVWGCILQKYRCTADNCGYDGPLFTREQIQRLDSTIPLACPICTNVGDFAIEQNESSLLGYIYTCDACGHDFAMDMPANRYQRAFYYPEDAWRWGNARSTSAGSGNDADEVFEWLEEDDSSNNDDDEPDGSPTPTT